ncbi:hypothetical protein FACS1894187_14780 [Synergistales bacterium]|nr:hypothetical protein FACS1894187_14780 [Synergistales bacterium]
MDRNLFLSGKERQQMLPPFDEVLLFSLERRYLDIVNIDRLELATNPVEEAYDFHTHLRMMKIDEVSHEGEPQSGLHLLNMQNVLAAMKDDSQNVVSVVRGTKDKTSLYYGLSKRMDSASNISTHEYAEVLRQTLHGNFLGVKMTPLSSNEIFDDILSPMLEHENVRAFPGIPSLRLKDPNGPYVQGIDRFIEGMRGEEYSLVTIAEPIPLYEIDAVIKNLFDLGSSIHSQIKATVQKMKGSSDTVNVGMFGMLANNTAQTDSTATTDSTAQTDSEANTDSSARTDSTGNTTTDSNTKTDGTSNSTSAFGATHVSGGFKPFGVGVDAGVSAGGGKSWGTSTSTSVGRAESFMKSVANTVTNALTRGIASTVTNALTRSVASTIGRTLGFGGTGGYAHGWNRSQAVTQEMLNKTTEYCEKLCDAYIERLQAGKNLGFWNVGVYLMTNNRYTQLRAQGLLRAAFSGDTTYWEPIRFVEVNPEAIAKYIYNFNNPKYNLFLYGEEQRNIEEALTATQKMKNYAASIGMKIADLVKSIGKGDNNSAKMLEEIRKCPANTSKKELDKAWREIEKAELGHPFGEMMGGVSTPLNTEELSIIVNVPRQEVYGVTIREATPFGINYVPSREGDDITIGKVVHKRTPMNDMPYVIPRGLFKKHAFVCGVTGSGKTNTCISLLRNLDLPFMVVEPAKTEYRQMLNFMSDLHVFTLGSEMVSPFRINPFEFSPGSELLTHIDSIKAVFNAAFPMYASMPYILEEAIIEIYRDKGWDLATSTNRYLKDLHSEEFFDYMPTLQDLFDKIEPIVKRKAYAQEQTMNIQAALLARLSSLLTGSKGLMLNTRRSTPIAELLNKRVVLELKNIGDDDEKCFMMGLILSAIYQYRENSGGVGSPLSHILLIEEAHRLLRRTPEFVSPEVGNSRGKAVETFTNVISEIREYGQGVIIVDQIPTKLTPDVVKNTNIKFIHRTLAQDDRDYVGGTLNLTEAQSRELCLLEVGQAVIHREGADKAFLVQITQSKGSLKNISNEEINAQMQQFQSEHSNVFARYPGFEKMDGIAEAYAKEDFRHYSDKAYMCIIGTFLVMMTGEMDALRASKENFHRILNDELGITNDVRRACYVIFYADSVFRQINERYPGHYDKCLKLQRFFIDYWFEEIARDADMRKTIAPITNVSYPYDGVFRWYLSGKSKEDIDAFKRFIENEPDFEKAMSFLRQRPNDVLHGTRLSQGKEELLRKRLLKELLIYVDSPRYMEWKKMFEI